jgi:hypothetical protein
VTNSQSALKTSRRCAICPVYWAGAALYAIRLRRIDQCLSRQPGVALHRACLYGASMTVLAKIAAARSVRA